jgi:hypothetical protein
VPIEFKINLALVTSQPPLKALADVTLQFSDGQVTIRRCAVFENDGRPPWSNLPRLLLQKNGRKHFAPLIELPSELRQRVLKAILAEYRNRRDAS